MSLGSRLALGLLSFGLVMSQANAQGFGINLGGGRGVRFGIGGGGYYGPNVGYYGGGWGRGYGPFWNAGRFAAGGPVRLVPNPDPNPAGGLIEIGSEADSVLKYSLNEYPYEIKAGQVQHLQQDRPWVIEFDRGGDYGFATYPLNAGRYKFVATEEGWDLVRATEQIGNDPPAPDLDDRRNPPPPSLKSAPPKAPTPMPLNTDEGPVLPVSPRTAPTPVDAIAPTELPALPAVKEPMPVTTQPTPVTPPLTKVKPRRAESPTPPTPSP